MSNQVLIGCDPEVFLLNKRGEVMSAEGVVGGTKYVPIWNDEGDYSLQEDNVMAEIGIKPASNALDFSRRISQALNAITSKGVGLSLKASEKFLMAALDTSQAKESGCMPDFNCYEKAMNSPIDLAMTDIRYSGGHVHLGLGSTQDRWMQEYDVDKVIMSMYYHVGIPMLKKEGMYNKKGLVQYRRLGNFRVKNYGLEYRTLSNSWIFNESTRKEIFNKSQYAVAQAHKLTSKMETELFNAYNAMK